MQVEIFSPVDVYAAACDNGQCYISGMERGTANGFGLHFDDADALGAFGLAIVEEARRLLREQDMLPEDILIAQIHEVPPDCGEEAP